MRDLSRCTHDCTVAYVRQLYAVHVVDQHKCAGTYLNRRSAGQFDGCVACPTVDAHRSATSKLRQRDGAVASNFDQRMVWQQCRIVASEPCRMGAANQVAPDRQGNGCSGIRAVAPHTGPLKRGSFNHQSALSTAADNFRQWRTL